MSAFPSGADVENAHQMLWNVDVRSSLNGGHSPRQRLRQLCANKRLMHRSNWQQIRRWSAGEMGSADYLWFVRGNTILNSLPLVRPRQYDLELGEKPGLCLDIDAATVLLDDYVVAHRQAKPGTFA